MDLLSSKLDIEGVCGVAPAGEAHTQLTGGYLGQLAVRLAVTRAATHILLSWK